jgi:hypothetical protein
MAPGDAHPYLALFYAQKITKTGVDFIVYS